MMTQVATIPAKKFSGGKAPTNLIERHQATQRQGRILQCFLNADLRQGHDGLEKLARQNNIDVTRLHPGQYVVFVNSHRDKVKVYAANGVVAYYRHTGGRIYDLRVLQEIPKAFNGTATFNMDTALKTVVEDALRRKRALKEQA
jgi:hypothetical protein